MTNQLKPLTSSESVKRSTGAFSSGKPTASRHSSQLTPEIDIYQLRYKDQVVIRTANSTYIFMVVDPSNQSGMVIGGLFGNFAAEARLEVVPVTRDLHLKAGARVRFIIRSGGGYKRVTTSAITSLIYRRLET